VKYSKVTGAVRWSGGTTLLRRGQSADPDHPLVKERPDLWTDQAPGASLSAPPTVERATRAPGEVRQTPRRGPRKRTEPAPEPVEEAAPDTGAADE
jgi:hypothetical protein